MGFAEADGVPPFLRGAPFLWFPTSGERRAKGLNGSVEGEKADGGLDARARAPPAAPARKLNVGIYRVDVGYGILSTATAINSGFFANY